MAIDTSGPWVSIVFLDGDDYETAMDETNDAGGSITALADYLAQWDYGDETDMAHTGDFAPGSLDTLHEAPSGGLDYVLSINHRLGYVSLNRRPLS